MPRSDFKKLLQLLKLNREHYRHSCCAQISYPPKKPISAKAPCGNDDSARAPISIIVSRFTSARSYTSVRRYGPTMLVGLRGWLAGHKRPRLCKNVFERDRYSKPD